MVDVVERHAVQENQVFVGAAATHIHPCRALGARLHARQQLQGLDDIGLAKQGRHLFQLHDGQLDGAHLGAFHVALHRPCRHGHFVQLVRLGDGDVDDGVVCQAESRLEGGIAHKRGLQAHLALAELQGVVTEVVGHRPLHGRRLVHRSADEGLLALAVHDVATDGVRLRGVLRHRHAQRQQQREQPNE